MIAGPHVGSLCRGLGSVHFNLNIDIPAVLEDNLGTSISRVFESVV